MIRAAVSGLIFLLLLSPSASLGQQQTAAPAPADEAALPNFGGRMVPGEAVVDLADFISSNLEATGATPDLAQVRTAGGELRNVTAAEVFVLLARTAYLWRTTGNLPDTVPITPDEVSPPVLDAQDVVLPAEDTSVGREAPTEQFLAQCPAVVRWVDRLQVIPTAVWVAGSRLSATEYLAGLAICVSYAYWEGDLSDTIFLPAYAPPTSWAGEAEYAQAQSAPAGEAATGGAPASETTEASAPAAEQASAYSEEAGTGEGYSEEGLAGGEEYNEQGLVGEEEQGPTEEGGAGTAMGYEEAAPEGVAPEAEASGEYAPEYEQSAEPQASEPGIPPTLEIIPEPGDTVRGMVDIVASYSGPPATGVIFTIDGRGEVIMNSPPYSYRWNTAGLEPGPHQVRVQVFGEDDSSLIDQTNAYIVAAPPPKKSPGNVGSK